MISIVECGGANIASIVFALERLGVTAQLTHDAELIKQSTHVILPGVGSAATAMRHLQQYNLIPVLCALTQPVLGICLGMQLLFDSSAEGNVTCLGLIPGEIKKFTSEENLRVPHMGWNVFNITKNNSLMKNISQPAYCYFVHSYFAPITPFTCATAHYGETFSAAVQYKNFYGVQFHPERSSKIGEIILANFLELP